MSPINIQALSVAGSEVNEDLIGYEDHTFWVMDGATPLSSAHFLQDESDARWFVKELDSKLRALLKERMNIPLKALLMEALLGVEERLASLKIDLAGMSPFELPSCTIILMRVEGKRLEYLVLGDCTLVILHKNEVLQIKDSANSRLDNQVVQAVQDKKFSDNPCREELEAFRMSLLQKNRSLMNTEEGYWVCTWDRKGIHHALSGELEIDREMKVLACTDGFSRIVDLYHQYIWDDLFGETVSLKQAMNEIRSIEAKDSSKEKYPRLKVSDDASALHLSIQA